MVHSRLKGLKKSRAGCYSCKRRRKKCNGGKPSCNSCTRLKLDCAYPAAIHWSKQNQLSISCSEMTTVTTHYCSNFSYMINFTIWDLSLFHHFNSSEAVCKRILSPRKLVIAQSADPACEQFLYNYYTEYLCKTKSFFFGGETNEFKTVIVPGCRKFRGLYYVVIALAAIDLMKCEVMKPANVQDRQQTDTYYSWFFEYKNKAINVLHEVLDEYDASGIDLIEELSITMVLLCSAEITNQGNVRWVDYLREGCLLFSPLTQNQILESAVLTFVYKYFSLRFIFLIGTLKKDKLTAFLESCPWASLDPIFNSDKIDHLFGCSPRLLHVVYRLIMLNHCRDLYSIDEKSLTRQYMEIWDSLQNLQQYSGNESLEIRLCARCYLLATKVYFCTLLWSGKLRIYSDYGFAVIYHHLLTELMDSLTELSFFTKHVCYPTWCIFIRSFCEILGVNGEVSRLRILSIIRKLDSISPLSSNVQVRKAMETIWKVYDLVIEDPSNYQKNDTFSLRFDWRDVLEEGGFMLALT